MMSRLEGAISCGGVFSHRSELATLIEQRWTPFCSQVACLIRVPTEVVKQRTQASPSSTTYNMLLATLREEVTAS